jgi:hypothetical protein
VVHRHRGHGAPLDRKEAERFRSALHSRITAMLHGPQAPSPRDALHRRPWDFDFEPEALDTSVTTFARAHLLQSDHRTGVDLAMLLELRALRLAQAGERDDAIADRVNARRTREEVLHRLLPLPEAAALQEMAPDKAYGLLACAWESQVGLGRADDAAATSSHVHALYGKSSMLPATEERIAHLRRTQARLTLALAAAPPRH